MKKEKTRREQIQNVSVDPLYNLKSRTEEIADIASYFDTLSEKEQKFMLKYTENMVNASFDKKNAKNNLITMTYTKNLIKNYVNQYKKKTADKQVISFIKKYLIRNDNIPVKLVHDIFFEEDDTKLLTLVSELKQALYDNLKNTRKRELNKVIKIIEKEIYGTNNSRNRCIITREKAGGSLSYLEDMGENDTIYNYEDAMISKIDVEANLFEELDNLDNRDSEDSDSSDNS